MILALSCMSHDIDVLLSELILSHVPSLPTQCFPTLIGHEQWFDLEVAEAVLPSRKRHYVAPLPDKNRSGCECAVSTQTIIIAP